MSVNTKLTMFAFALMTLLIHLHYSFACIMQPRESIVMSIKNRTWAVGTHLKVDVAIQHPTPDFKTVLRLREEVADESSFDDNFRPKNKTITYMLERAGRFTVQFEVLWYGKPFSLTDTLWVYQPVLQPNFQLSMEEMILFPPGSGSLSLKIFGLRELPTNVSGKLEWGDGFDQELNLVNKTGPGSSYILLVPLSHQYEKVGNYTISLRLFNEVSSETKRKSVRVITRLVVEDVIISTEKDLLRRQSQSDIFFSSEEIISFSTNLLSGDSDLFCLQVEDKNISSPHLPINYTFLLAGIYNVQMWAFGTAGISNILTKTLKIQRAITDNHVTATTPNIVVTPPGHTSLTVTVSDSFELPTGIIGSIEWEKNSIMNFDWEQYSAAGRKGHISFGFKHTYIHPSIYNITLRISNRVSQISKIIETNVIPILVLERIYASTSPDFEENNDDTFACDKEIYFKVEMKSGDPHTFYIGIDGKNETSESQPLSYSLSMTGIQSVVMWTTGLAGESNVLEKFITIQRPVIDVHLTLLIQDTIVTPPGLTSLEVSITDYDELPTAISGAISWGENEITKFDWAEYTKPGAKGVVSNTFNHTYPHPANYTINVQISNRVSRIKEELYANVIPELEVGEIFVSILPTFRDYGSQDIFASNKPIFFKIILSSGDSNFFHLQINGKTETSPTLPITHTISMAGTYMIRMWATGPAGKSNEATKTIRIQRPMLEELLSLELQNTIVTPPGLASLEIRITDETELPSNIYGYVEWEMGHFTHFDWTKNTTAGTKGVVSSMFKHIYALPSNYTVSVNISNEVSEITKTITANVIPHLTIGEIYCSTSPTFDDGGADFVFASKQEIYFKTDLKSGDVDIIYLEIDGVNTTSETLPLTYSVLMAGRYGARMWVTGEAGTSNIQEKTIIIQRRVMDNQISIQIQDIIVVPPGRVCVDVVLLDEEELPTNISGSVTWKANDVTEFDWKEYSAEGESGTIARSFNHTYLHPSNYLIVVNISNRISEVTKVIEAYVIPELVIDLIYASNTTEFGLRSETENVFPSNEKIIFKTALKSGDAEMFHLEINDQNKTEDTLPLTSVIPWAGSYDVRMWASGEAGLSNIVHKIITIQKPITPEHVNLCLRGIIVTPPGFALLRITVYDEVELPTSLTGVITWEENRSIRFNWENSTSPGEKGEFTQDFNYTYEFPLNHTISVEISNKISRISKSIHANVIPELRIENIIPSSSSGLNGGNDEVFSTHEAINFSTELKIGDSEMFVLEIDQQNITSPTLPISFSFPMAGTYQVRMWATGEAGVSNVLNDTIIIERPLSEEFLDMQIDDIIVTPPGSAILNITLEAPGELPTLVRGVIEWQQRETNHLDWREFTQPGTMDPISQDIRHSYLTPGNYTISVEFRNRISFISKSVTTMVVPRLTIEELKVKNVRLDGLPKSNSFPTKDPLEISAMIKSGIPDTYYLRMDDQILSSKTQPIIYKFRLSGLYTLTYWVTGLAGQSNEVSREVEIQREIFSDTINFEGIPTRPVGHKGEVSFLIHILDTVEPPTDVHIDVNWGDETPKETIQMPPDLNSFNGSSLATLLKHQYKRHGDYMIKLSIRNAVSNFTKEFTVTIVEKILLGGISLELEYDKPSPGPPLCKYAFILVNEDVIIKPERFSGHVTQWKLSIENSTVMESDDGIFRHNFTMAGWFNITLIAFGLDDDSETVSRSVFMGEEVTNLVATAYPNITSLRLPSVIAIRTSWVSGACLYIDFNDGTPVEKLCDSLQCNGWSNEGNAAEKPPNPDVFAKHIYESTGLYEVQVQLVGPLNSLTKAVNVVVIDKVICEEMKVLIENPTSQENPKKVRRQDSLRLQSKSVLSGCRAKLETTIEWNIEELDTKFVNLKSSKKQTGRSDSRSSLQTFPVTRHKNLTLHGFELHKPVLIIPEKLLTYGFYYISVTYNFLLNDEEYPIEAKLVEVTVVEIVKSKLIVKMTEGTSEVVLRGDQQMLNLCAFCYSYDPDAAFEIANYTWWCIREGEEWTSSVVPSFGSTRAGYGQKRDGGGCFGDGPGILNIKDGGWSLNASLFFVIPGRYSVRVEVTSEDGRTARSVLALEIVKGNPPILSSSCTPAESCMLFDEVVYVNPVKMVLSTSCVQDNGLSGQNLQDTMDLGDDGCGSPPVQYEWIVYGFDLDFVPVKLNLTGYAIGMDRFNFAILEDFWFSPLGNFEKYEVSVLGKREGQESKGKSLMFMKPNKPPIDGNCAILRNETGDLIKALVEQVSLECHDWKDPEMRGIGRYKFSVVYESGSKSPLWSGQTFPAPLYFPFGNFTLLAEILDAQEAVALYTVATITTSLPSNEEFQIYVDSGILSTAIEKQELSLVNMLLQAEKSVKPHMKLNDSQDDTEANAEYLKSLDVFPMTNMDDVLQAGSILSTVAYPLPEGEQNKAIGFLLSLSNQNSGQGASPNLQKEFATNSLGTVVSLLKGVNEVQENQASIHNPTITENTFSQHCESNADKKYKVESLMSAIENSQMGIFQSSVVGEEAAVMKSEGIVTTAIGFFDASELEGKRMDVDGAIYVFPHYCDLFRQSRSCLVNKSISVGIRMAKWATQVYGFGGGMDLLSDESSTVQLSLVDTWMNPIPVNNSLGDIIIHIPRQASDIPEPTLIMPDMMPKQKFMAHKIDIESPGLGVNIFVRFEENFTCCGYEWILTWSFLPPYNTYNLSVYYLKDLNYFQEIGYYGLFISSEKVGDIIGPRYLGIARRNVTQTNETEEVLRMSDEEFHEEIITSEPWNTKSAINHGFSLQPTIPSASLVQDYGDSLFINDEFIQHNSSFSNSSDYSDYYSHGENSTDSENATRQFVSELEDAFETNYTLITFVSSCLFFDKGKIAWSSDGCKVIDANLTTTTCACNHLTSFGSGLIVAPNAIDFSYVFANADFTENLTIYLTLIFMASFAIIGFVCARFMDIRDKKKVGATPLPDNDPRDKYLYDIFVHTGLYPGSGTRSNVFFTLNGEWDETGVRELKDLSRVALSRGGHDHFVMASELPLGPLQYLRIWHDNSAKGSKASWFFSYMVVRDIQTGEEFQFICNQWLAVEEGDGQIDRIVPVAGDTELKDFSHVFGMTVERNLSDDHLWISLFMRPPSSRFTRVQRLGAVVALLFLSMLVNAMFYDKVSDNPNDGGLTVGPFSLSPQAMSVGVISNFIVFLPSFIIVFCFRKSRPRKTKPSRIKEALYRQRSTSSHEEMKMDKEKVKGDSCAQSIAQSITFVDENNLAAKEVSRSSSAIYSASTSGGTKKKYLEIKKKKKFRLPWWCRFIAWILVIVSIGTSVFFLWAYGIQFGDAKVQRWLTSLVVSIVCSMFITQPIKIYLMALILSMILKKPLNDKEDYDDDEELMELEYDEELLHTKDPCRPQRKKLTIGSPLSQEELRAVRQKREKEVAMNMLIKEIIIYLLFLSVILAISYGSRDPWIIFMKMHFSNLFAKSSSSNCSSFLKMKTTNDIWCWSKQTFVPAILDDHLYNGMSIYDPEVGDQMKTTLSDRISYLLGSAIFRQIRVIPNSCEIHPWIEEHLLKECNGFSGFYQEHEDIFGKKWETNTTEPDPSYTYRSPMHVQGIPFTGTLDTYGGGGYFVKFPNQIFKALALIEDLEKNFWIDKYTRAFFAEVAIYNAQVNLFGVIMCVAEFIPGGGLQTSFKFHGLNLLRYHSGAGIFMLVSELAFVIFTIFFIRREHQIWKKEGKKYFRTAWNWMEAIVIFLSIATIVFYTIKTLYSLYLIDQLTATSGKKYIRMQSLAVLDEILTNIIGFLLFIATIKLLKLLRFNKKIGFLSETLKAASSDIFGFSILFVITLISFVSVFHIEAITASVEFSTFVRAAETSIFEITKKFHEVTQVSPIVGPLFYFIFALIMNWVVLQVLIAIICNTFARIKKDLSAQPNDYEVVDYMMDRFAKFLIAVKLKKGKVAHHNPQDKSTKENLEYINKTLDRIMLLLDKYD